VKELERHQKCVDSLFDEVREHLPTIEKLEPELVCENVPNLQVHVLMGLKPKVHLLLSAHLMFGQSLINFNN
jgi:hypothetical protein